VARKRTKEEALKRLADSKARTAPARKGLKGKAKIITDAAYLGAAGLIMLDPLDMLADSRIVLPLDMVAIPAYQAYMIEGSPSMQIYIRAGETIVPTGGNVRDVQEALDEAPVEALAHATVAPKNKKRTAYQKAYTRAFGKIAPKHKKKDGTWKKGGFRKAVKEAHAKAKK
tara:strand:- start:116 stop:628 length:513 start_codon:yes stop_codon:yes gene_type:complete